MARLMRVMVLIIGVLLCVSAAQPPLRLPRGDDGPLVPRKEILYVLSAGHRTFFADFFWIRMMEQVGRANRADEYRDIGVWADLATDLDPKFELVYRYAGVTIPFNMGRNTWVNGDVAAALLRKGVENFPDNVYLKFLLANNLLIYMTGHHLEAGRILKSIANEPRAPKVTAALATRALAQGGDFESALSFAQGLAETSFDEESRRFFQHRVRQLQSERLLQQIDQAAAEFRDEHDRVPTIDELISAGAVLAPVFDPLGGKLFIDRNGRARTTAEWHRLEFFTDESKAAATEALGEKEDFKPQRVVPEEAP